MGRLPSGDGDAVQDAVGAGHIEHGMHHAIGLGAGYYGGRTVRTPSDTVPTNLRTETPFAAMVATVCLSGPVIRAGAATGAIEDECQVVELLGLVNNSRVRITHAEDRMRGVGGEKREGPLRDLGVKHWAPNKHQSTQLRHN